MSNEHQLGILYGILTAVILFVTLYIARSYFSIPRLLRYQKAQLRLLEEIAKAHGIDAEKIKAIVNEGGE